MRQPLGCNRFLMSTINRTGKPVRADIARREPRCRICRHESMRFQVNQLLDWRGVPVFLGGSKTHLVTYADILVSWSPSTRPVTRGTGSPTTASGFTPSVTTRLTG